MKAGALAGVAGRAGRLDEREQRVAVAVARAARAPPARCRWSRPCATARRASGSRGAARRSRACARSASRVHVGERQHLAAAPVLHDARHEAALVVGDAARRSALPPAALIAHDCRYAPARARGFETDCRRDAVDSSTASCSSSPARAASARRRSRPRSGCWPRERGRRTIVVEVGEQSRAAGAVRRAGARARASETRLERGPVEHLDRPRPRAAGVAAGARRARVRGACSPRAAPSSTSPRRRPGRKELVSMVKIWQLTRRSAGAAAARGYDLVVLDAPATGHALGMLRSPRHVRRDRARRPDRRDRPSRCASCSQDPARTRLPRRSRRPRRWRSPRRSSCRTGCASELGRELDGGRRQRRCCRGASARAELERLAALLDRRAAARDRRAARRSRPRGSSRRSAAHAATAASGASAAAAAARAVHERARLSTTSSRACAAAASTCSACRSVRAPSSTCRRSTDRRAPAAQAVSDCWAPASCCAKGAELLRGETVLARGRDRARAARPPTAS